MVNINCMIFKDIIGYEGIYRIYESGDIWSYPKVNKHNGKFLKKSEDKDGYLLVRLSKNKVNTTKKVHRLVAENFLSRSKDQIVNHKDHNVKNNNVNNLEWVSSKENNMFRRPRKNKIYSKYKGVYKSKDRNKYKSAIFVNGKLKYLLSSESEIECAKAYNIAAKKYYGKFAVYNEFN